MRRAGFTLIEMLAVALLTGVVLAAAANFYIDLSRESRSAIELVRGDRRSVAILDRVARDLESAVLLKKAKDQDPLTNPWLFYADEAGDFGSERLKFTSRGRIPRISAEHESDFEMVAYWLQQQADGSFDLVRWSAPHLPDGQDLTFPAADDPGAAVLAHGVAGFGVVFTSEGGPAPTWNSTTLVESSELPLAAKISLLLLPEAEDGTPLAPDPNADTAQVIPFSRSVLFPVPPIDLAKEQNKDDANADDDQGDDQNDEDGDGVADDGVGDGSEDESQCMTVGQCIAQNQAAFQSLPPETQAAVQSMAGVCFRDVAGSLALPGVVGCQ